MVDQKNLDDHRLDQLFSAAQKSTPIPTTDFMARLHSEANKMVPVPERMESRSTDAFSWLAGLFTASGLSGAVALGVWIGLASPDIFSTVSPFQSADNTVTLSDFLPAANFANTDGGSQ